MIDSQIQALLERIDLLKQENVLLRMGSSKRSSICSSTRHSNIGELVNDEEAVSRAIIEVRRATHVPNMDGPMSRGSDVYVEAQLHTLLPETAGAKLSSSELVSWPVIDSVVNPVWNKVRVINPHLKHPVPPFIPDNTSITFTVIDKDSALSTMLRGVDIIGQVVVPIHDLADHEEKELTVDLTAAATKHCESEPGKLYVQPCKLYVRLVPEPTVTKKTIFFIRHGESKWNEAQAKWAVQNMLKVLCPVPSRPSYPC
jgi:hypothetical protein